MQELWFLHSARRLMLIDIYMKFREDSLHGYQVTEWARLCDRVQGKQLKKYKRKSYGSCALHVVKCWLIFIWSNVKITWTVFK